MRLVRLQMMVFAAMLAWSALFSAQTRPAWRAATPAELEAFLPARAPVEKERIETEMRTATGIISDSGKNVAAVVLITAGYAAEGKYSHYLLTQATLHVGANVRLLPGAYVLGWNRTAEGLLVHFFDARSGADRGTALAGSPSRAVRVEPFKIWPPGDKNAIQIGRFFVSYSLE